MGILLRILPFWIREPLAIGLCAVMGFVLLYQFFAPGEVQGMWKAAGFGVLFLVIGVVRFFVARKEWRSRRSAGNA